MSSIAAARAASSVDVGVDGRAEQLLGLLAHLAR